MILRLIQLPPYKNLEDISSKENTPTLPKKEGRGWGCIIKGRIRYHIVSIFKKEAERRLF
jgi:hypothetical protein